MKLELDFSFLDQYQEKLSQEDIVAIKLDICQELDSQLEDVYGLVVDDDDEYEEALLCGCRVRVELFPLNERFTRQQHIIDVNFCNEHDMSEAYKDDLVEAKELLTKYAEELWLKDKDAKFDWRHRELFEMTGV